MAVEIKELVIRAIARQDQATSVETNSAAQASENNQQAVIQACVNEVLRILERKNAK